MIQAIETEFAGYKFRSRLEARWAVFFNAMGVKWYYEHEGYKLSSGWYLPDFWLPEWKLHVEVKPDGVCKHAKAFRDSVSTIVVTRGLPEEPVDIYGWDYTDSTGGCGEFFNSRFADCPFGIYTGLTRMDRSYYASASEPCDFIFNGVGKRSLKLRDAFNLAKQSRFDKQSKKNELQSGWMSNQQPVAHDSTYRNLRKVGSVVEYVKGVDLLATDNQPFRIERLKKTLAFICAHAESSVRHIKRLQDHEGNLTCVWRKEHDYDSWYQTVTSAWCEVGELPENVSHEYAI